MAGSSSPISSRKTVPSGGQTSNQPLRSSTARRSTASPQDGRRRGGPKSIVRQSAGSGEPLRPLVTAVTAFLVLWPAAIPTGARHCTAF